MGGLVRYIKNIISYQYYIETFGILQSSIPKLLTDIVRKFRYTKFLNGIYILSSIPKFYVLFHIEIFDIPKFV